MENNDFKIITVHLDSQSFDKKPNNSEITAINKRLNKSKVEMSLEELLNQVGDKGHSFTPATFKDNRRLNTNFESQQLFCLDFDNGVAFEKTLTRLKEFGLDATFAYKSFSWSEDFPKYRVGFITPESITDKQERDFIQLALMILFNEKTNQNDKVCKDAARLFYGGKGILYKNYEYILDVDLLKTAAASIKTENVDDKNKSLILNRMFKTVRKMQNPFNIYKGKLQKSYTFYEKDIQVNFEKLRKSITILDSLMAGREWFYYPQLRGLALNLMFFRGGVQFYKKCLKESGYPYEKKHYDLPTVLKKQYGDNWYPETLSNFSPYEKDWQYKNFIDANLSKVTIKRIGETPKSRPVDEVRDELARVNQKINNNPKPSTNIINPSTGAGKTYRIQRDFEDCVIAFANHSLANEFAENYKKPHIITPRFPEESVNFDVVKKYKYLVEAGLQQEAFDCLRKSGDLAAKRYADEVISFYKDGVGSETIITTHHKALHWLRTGEEPGNKNTYVFDEDIFDKLIVTDSIKIGTLTNFINNHKLSHLFKKFLDRVNCNDFYVAKNTADYFDISEDEITTIENLVFSNKQIEDPCKILKLINSNYFVKKDSTISFCTVNIPNFNNKKIIIYTATPPTFIYKKLLKDFNLQIIDLGNVELKGKLTQYTRYSCSKYNLDEHHKKISHFIGKETVVITYKSKKNYFSLTDPDIHFNKCVGSNRLEGKSVAVVGNVTLPISVYALYAAAIGIETKEDDFHTTKRRCKYNGFEFCYNTFARSELQQLHFSLTESELMQAVGRARLVNHDVECLVFSNYPLPITTAFINKALPEAPEDYEVNPQSYYSLPAPEYKESNKIRWLSNEIMSNLLKSISKDYKIPSDNVLDVAKRTLRDNPEWKRVDDEELALHHYIDSLVLF